MISGAVLASTRRAARISQSYLARSTGLSAAVLSLWERGYYPLKPVHIKTLELALRSELERRAKEAQDLLQNLEG